MSRFLNEEELENLKSLGRDLVDPVKSFTREVHSDTVGDAKKFYAGQARKLGRSMKSAQEQARLKREALRIEQEAQRRRRRAMMKKAAIAVLIIALIALLIVSIALSRSV